MPIRAASKTIELSIAEYEAIRSSPVRLPVKAGHDYPEFEEDRRAERLKTLRRKIAAEWAETDSKKLTPHVLDEMILELAEDHE